MRRKFKINPTTLHSGGSGYIPPVETPRNGEVSFNFKRLYVKGDKFNYKGKDTSYFLALVERLRNLCSMSRMDLLANRSSSLRCHRIDFSESNVSEETFGILGEDIDNDAWQLGISANAHGRIHGYFVGDVFYVVWFDPYHELCPGSR
jgi:hypothetical protein